MPLFLIGLLIIISCICFVVIYMKKTEKAELLDKKVLNIAIFALSLISLLISIKLFWNMGVYADEYGSSPVLISGGWFWLYMDWLRLGVLFVISIISGLKLIKRSKE